MTCSHEIQGENAVHWLLTSTDAVQRTLLQSRLRRLSDCIGLRIAKNKEELFQLADRHRPDLLILTEDVSHLTDADAAKVAALAPRVALFCESVELCAVPSFSRFKPICVEVGMDDTTLRTALFDNNRSQPTQRRVILLGASTGGVEALIEVLSGFPSDCPPTFLVQHTGGGFSAGLSRLLDSRVGIHVREAGDGMAVHAGTAVLGPGDRLHMEVNLNGVEPRCRLVDRPAIGGHRPAVDVLFQSAVPHAKRVIAAILTGMGRDGAEGLLALKKAGARTFGQDEATSLVYGMPKVASDIGAVEHQLPLDRIAPALIGASFERTAK